MLGITKCASILANLYFHSQIINTHSSAFANLLLYFPDLRNRNKIVSINYEWRKCVTLCARSGDISFATLFLFSYLQILWCSSYLHVVRHGFPKGNL